MKVVAINGSPRKGGNTDLLLREVLKPIEKKGIEVEIIQLGGKDVKGCIACGKCHKKGDGRCHISNKFLNECIEKMVKADGIILGSPVYFGNVSTELKALIDVAGYATRSGMLLRRKVGAAVVAVRRAGELFTFDAINHFFLINEMIVPGSTYWNVAIGRDKGDVLQDKEGMETMKNLGGNMAWLLEKLG